MTPGDKLELHLPSRLGAEKAAMEFAATVAKSMNFPPERVEDLKTAIAEACINAIEHGNKLHASMRVGVKFTVGEGELQVAVHDQGKGLAGNPERPDLESRMEGRKDPRGWGIFLIENLMDEVSFESTAEGNVTRMIIYLEKGE